MHMHIPGEDTSCKDENDTNDDLVQKLGRTEFFAGLI